MKKVLLLSLTLAVSTFGNSQTTWSEHAAEVFYNNCTVCHNVNGIAPNPLMTYFDAVNYAALIQTYVGDGTMPPWTADSSYQHYSQERILTQSEKDIILDWITDGTQSGDLGQAPPPPVYSGDQMLPGTPDLVVTAPNYMSKATLTSDDYVCFVIPTNLATTRIVKAIEVIPGNRQTVHHCLVYNDNTGFVSTDTSGGCAGPVTSTLMGGYTPGATPIIFPSTLDFRAGMTLSAGTEIVLAMHYPQGSFGEWDQTKVNFYFYDEPVVNFREVHVDRIIEDWSFTIPAFTFDSIQVDNSPTSVNQTLLSVFPHMHLLGNYIEAWGVTPAMDTLNFAKIPLWDFEWQDFYWFEYMKYIPAGTTFHGKGVWDNTVGNPNNPNSPPLDVSAGLNTSDEMFLVYFHYMDYWVGDELINVDSLTTEFLSAGGSDLVHENVKTFPNPFDESTDIYYYINNAGFVSLFIYDIQGKLVNKLAAEQQAAGSHKVNWNGDNSAGKEVGAGMYFYSIMIDGMNYSGKIMKR